jgi:hypothetical protein
MLPEHSTGRLQSLCHLESSVDVTVRPMPGGKDWSLIDLLRRGQATETMAGLSRGPYASLDSALGEIETHTRGVCRLDEGDAQ